MLDKIDLTHSRTTDLLVLNLLDQIEYLQNENKRLQIENDILRTEKKELSSAYYFDYELFE